MERTNHRAALGVDEELRMERTNQRAALRVEELVV